MTQLTAAHTFRLPTNLTTLTFLLALIIFPFSFASAVTYTTVASGSWSDNAIWKNKAIAPSNITNKDLVEIFHKVSTGNMKINNGGTLVIYAGGNLSGDDLDMNGKDSQIIIEGGAMLSFNYFVFDNRNNADPIVISNRDLVPLPVSLVYFDVKRTAQPSATTTLEWTTASEKNNAYFAVEKSLDGKEFKEAGRVTGKNAPNGAKYTFEDKITASVTYFRLKQVDFDGKTTYSAIVVATSNQKPAVHGRTVLFSNAYTGKLNVMSVTGQQVKTFNLQNVASFELPENLQGVYLLQMESGNQVSTQRLAL